MGAVKHLAELVRALAVLALMVLNFAHAPLNAADVSASAWSTDSFCGDIIDGGDSDGSHAPCHACRIGSAADLPPPCGLAEPSAVATAHRFSTTPDGVAPRPSRGAWSARGPPLA